MTSIGAPGVSSAGGINTTPLEELEELELEELELEELELEELELEELDPVESASPPQALSTAAIAANIILSAIRLALLFIILSISDQSIDLTELLFLICQKSS